MIGEVAAVPEGLAAGLSELIGDGARVLTAPQVLDRLSHDFYWYSPVLKPLLVDKVGEVAVQPVSTDEVLAVLRYAGKHGVPVTVRGAARYAHPPMPPASRWNARRCAACAMRWD